MTIDGIHRILCVLDSYNENCLLRQFKNLKVQLFTRKYLDEHVCIVFTACIAHKQIIFFFTDYSEILE